MKLAKSPRRAPTEHRNSATGPTSIVADAWHIGVDEAGYGPNLGPLVVASTAFRGPVSLVNGDWWKTLRHCVGRSAKHDGLAIDDSKAIYSKPDGPARLARSVKLLLALAGVADSDLASSFLALAPEDIESLRSEHWYERGQSELAGVHGSEDVSSEVLASIRDGFREAAVEIRRPRARAVFPAAFNHCLEWAPSKADVELTVVRDLLRWQLAAVEPDCKRVVVTVDRLGGRRYYREIVEDIAQDSFVFTMEEKPNQSAYRFENGGRQVDIRFCVKGDRNHLPVAAASMIAKHLRERCMREFNAFWSRQIDGIAPTAGYPVDARRFLNEIEPHLPRLNVPIAALWRCK